MSEPETQRGLFASLRQLLGTAVEIASVRLALLSTEIEQEKVRLFDAVFWGAFALVLLTVGLALLSGFIVVLFWDSYRLIALGVLTVLYLGGGAWLLQTARKRLRCAGGLFSTSVAELECDRAGLDRPQ
jgi:uncharacterized membrane protein YqjE